MLEIPLDVPENKKIRVLISQGERKDVEQSDNALTISRALRNAGLEIVYCGSLDCEQIVEAAIQEDVDIVYLNDNSVKRLDHYDKVVQLLEMRGLLDQVVVLTNELNFITSIAHFVRNIELTETNQQNSLKKNYLFEVVI